jgi:hypothetical protein
MSKLRAFEHTQKAKRTIGLRLDLDSVSQVQLKILLFIFREYYWCPLKPIHIHRKESDGDFLALTFTKTDTKYFGLIHDELFSGT